MNVEIIEVDWRTPILGGLRTLSKGEGTQNKTLPKHVTRYILIDEDLYKW